MADLRILEYVRDPDGVWNLPGSFVAGLAREFPHVRFDSPATREAADAEIANADIVLGFAASPANFAAATKLRWIHATSTGVTGLMFPALAASPVLVTNARGVHAPAMAEHALGVLLAFTRRLHRARDAQRERRWIQRELWQLEPSFGELSAATLGLIGFGSAGQAIAIAARGFGMHVLAVRRHPEAIAFPADEQWPQDRLPELLSRSDFVVLVAPHTPATTHLLGAAELALMKPGARLVNLGRGALVDEPALVAALRSGALAGAALDVFEHEPLPADSPLWEMPEVILTPHTSGVTPGYWARSCRLFADNLRRFIAGEPLVNVVNKQAGY